MTVAELSARMSTREMAEHMIYDKLKREAAEEAALDSRLKSDHASLIRKMKGG